MRSFTTNVEYDAITQDYFITIPDEILLGLNWKEGDTLNWEVTDSKQIIITKIKDADSENKGPVFKNTPEEYHEDFDKYYDAYLQNLNKDTFYENY